MANIALLAFRDEAGGVPFVEWLESLPEKAQDKCRVRLERLAEMGHELRRPEADYLRDGVYELRIKFLRVNHRILYFFHGRTAVILSHGLQKEKAVPPKEIDLARDRKSVFISDPAKYTAKEDIL
ncbi:MAG: type II toxin-antitoxin system RelE/ParE family toxin [Gemmataceae bacterium]|nr:type II toxin-antitoxin system RelE/ParE family toxin [Gemmataceae bacterium]